MKSMRRGPLKPACGQPAFFRIYTSILYRTLDFAGIAGSERHCVALLVGFACWAVSRRRRKSGRRSCARRAEGCAKKEDGPRAVGVLQMAANGKVTLVPIAILINGKFWDASEYKADPVPMALEPGTVYEAERAGSSLGLFTVNSALHSRAVNVLSPWIATGQMDTGGK
jgi:hypothetical protein